MQNIKSQDFSIIIKEQYIVMYQLSTGTPWWDRNKQYLEQI